MKVESGSLRRITQVSVLVWVTVMGILHQTLGGGPRGIASIHALCPFGGIESFYSLVTEGEFIKKTFYSNVILVAGSTLLVIVFGRIFCGWICALGTLQDISGGFGRRIFRRRLQVPAGLDRPLRKMKYLVLAGVVYFTWKTGELVLNAVDPFAAYSHISAGWEELTGEYLIGFGILLAMLTASLLYDRLFCRYLCPLGAYYALASRLSLFRIRRAEERCTGCGKCDRECPAGLKISASKEVEAYECLGCMECISVCPTRKKSLVAATGSKKLRGRTAGVLGAVLFMGIILMSKVLGIYQETPDNIQEILKGNPSNIRGWMSVEDLSGAFSIPRREIYRKIGVSPEELPPETPIKESEEILRKKGIEFDHDRIGEAVSAILGREGGERVSPEASAGIRGSMTIKDIAEENGLTLEEVAGRLEIPEDAPEDVELRDLSREYGVEMSELKARWEKREI